MLIGSLTALVVIALDQLSKFLMLSKVLHDVYFISFNPYFNLVRMWNTGVSFSMFNDYGNLGRYLLIVLALLIVSGLLWWMKKEQNKLIEVCLGFIIGGAIGNVIDRIRYGAVFDFLDFSYNGYHWPAFNVADSFICVGAITIIVHSIVAGIKKGK